MSIIGVPVEPVSGSWRKALLPNRFPRRMVQLLAGLVLFGVSMGFLLRSNLGLAPWLVFHQGCLSGQAGRSVLSP